MDQPDLLERLTRIEQELEQLRRIAMFRRRVDLVEHDGVKVFLYSDDLIREVVRQRVAAGTPPFPAMFSGGPRTVDQVWGDAAQPLLAVIMSHYARQHMNFVFLDVGCHYGLTVISTTRLLRALGLKSRIIAFDPGVAGELAPFNFALNGVADQVIFEPLAITNRSGPCAVYSELGHSQDNRIVNRIEAREVASSAVEGAALDDYVNFPEHLIVKIDTQGAEKEVFEGMRRLIGDRQVTVFTEFTPHALMSRVDPNQWVAQLGETFHVFDIGGVNAYVGPTPPLVLVNPVGFAEQVDARPSRYTDLLLVPRGITDEAQLLARLK